MKNFLKITYIIILSLAVVGSAFAQTTKRSLNRQTDTESKVEFPTIPVEDGNVNKPQNEAMLDVSPPGFAWWRAGDVDRVYYKLFVYDAAEKEFFVSHEIDDPVFVPNVVFPVGKYTWIVRAYDKKTKEVLAEREKRSFTIEADAYELPMPDPAKMLAQVPVEHPKLIFTKADLPALKKRLETDMSNNWSIMQRKAENGLTAALVKDPTFHTITDRKDYAQKRTDYRVDFHAFGSLYLDVVQPLAFVYMITGEKKYGEAAKKHLLRLTEFALEGGFEFYDSKFDEIPLQVADALPQAYDWAYNAFTPAEREKMETWMVAFGDKLLDRMSAKQRDFYNQSGESHDGRVPPYLINLALVLSNQSAAVEWLRFGLTASLTVYPQWATDDGGWAEGISYALTYSGRFIPPLEAILRSTDFNLWERPFYKNFPYFLTYCISPGGEITPFGDGEDRGVRGERSTAINSMLAFYATRNQDAQMRWWANRFERKDSVSNLSMKTLIQDLMMLDTLTSVKPAVIVEDRAFKGVGWGALHSDIVNTDKDLFLLFKSSPFGSESHSHLDQNSFAIMKGGKALAIPAGSRYPQHGSPFHTRYVRQSIAHNTILVNGKGQVDRNSKANGLIFDFYTSANIGYVAGEAQNTYEGVKRFDRHIVMIKPSIIVIVDDIELDSPGTVDWLLHGIEKFSLDEKAQQLVSVREDVSMTCQFIANQPLKFHQDDVWPMDPKEGYPMVKTPNPDNQWHFKATTPEKVQKQRIVSVMTIDKEATASITPADKDEYIISAKYQSGTATVKVTIADTKTLMSIVVNPDNAPKEEKSIYQK
ncbi:MAG: DUF4962 domain-containing protein [Bacteroidales bacterium]|nr:DUF4962 domain-containing protein [Bacteroidales bacterium]MCL2133345.1 DUF4962 domain-containing protein [Bacteroidales bacterium]